MARPKSRTEDVGGVNDRNVDIEVEEGCGSCGDPFLPEVKVCYVGFVNCGFTVNARRLPMLNISGFQRMIHRFFGIVGVVLSP